MHTKYHKGRQFEYKVKKFLERLGFIVVRCARSKPIDLIAFKKGVKPLFIECKSNPYVSPSRKQLLERLVSEAGAELVIVTKEGFDEFKKKMFLRYAEAISSSD